MNKELLKDIIEWDIDTWKFALYFWNKILPEKLFGYKALEIGSRNGGISLYLALKCCNVICSDVNNPSDKAIKLHKKYKVDKFIKYEKIDATCIPYPENYFDIVAFKSVLGAIGRNNNKAMQQKAIAEIYRVLKEKGVLLFAENLKCSYFHILLRKRFVKWGKSWRYISIDEMKEFTSKFSYMNYSTYGFISLLGKSDFFRKIFHIFDIFIMPIVGRKNGYVIYGYARK